MKIGFDAKRYWHNSTGLGNYARTLVGGIRRFFPETELALYDCGTLQREFRLGRKAAAEGCDVFHGLSGELPLDINRAGLKSVVTIHDTCWRTFPSMYHPADRAIYDFKCRLALSHADRVVAISSSTRDELVRLYGADPSRISVVYQSVDPLYFEPVSPDAARERVRSLSPEITAGPFVLSVGSINSRKNLLGTLKALASMKDRPQLVVCGRGRGYAADCRAFASSELSGNDVIWLESADNESLKALYTAAEALVYPSFSEGFGLPVAEALLQRTPVVTSCVSSLPEAAGPGALLVNPADTDAIADAISRILESRDLASDLAERGYLYCTDRFNPRRATEEMVRIFAE